MTLSVRNRFFRGEIILAAFSLLFIAAGGYFAYKSYPEIAAAANIRSGGLVQSIVKNFFDPSAVVPFWTAAAAAAYSLAGLILINFFFEKTQSPEILFFSFFAVSLSFEFARIMLPLKTVFPFPAVYLISSARFLLFGRYFGLFSLFAASVYAAGLDGQKQRNIFLMAVLAALIIALNIPVDSLVWDTTLKMLSGYGTMFAVVEAGILVVTLLTFFAAAHIRSSLNYVFVGIGMLLLLSGRNILLSSDTWITPLPGLALLAAGTWLVCTRLHREYLWL